MPRLRDIARVLGKKHLPCTKIAYDDAVTATRARDAFVADDRGGLRDPASLHVYLCDKEPCVRYGFWHIGHER
jgi:hypothetical protein